jgi:hypothetical protein
MIMDTPERRRFRPLPALILLFLAGVLPALGGVVPKPEDVLGFRIGDDYRLATYVQAIGYLRQVASVSDRIKLFDMGKTSMGQTMTYAVISSPANLAALEKHKATARRLSLAAGLTSSEAAALAKEGRAIVYIDGGLHASECAPAQHNIQLAYDLVTAADPKSLRILDDVILVLVFANPDGMNLLAGWYRPNVGTPYEVSPMPYLYHIYAGHDNNRDALIANLVETQNLARLVDTEWYPVIVYNHHQTAPFPARIWTPPNSEPTNPNVHPLIVRWQNLIGSAMGAAFDEEGKEGAISRIVFDTWYPGYMTQVYDSHNIISILTETALYEYATPHFYTVPDFPKEYQDLTMSAFYPSPWKGGWWRLRDAVDYCLTASMSVLDTASKFRSEMLFNKYKMAADVMDRFRKEPPYAWIVPEKQSDPGTAGLLLNRMALLGIDVYRAEDPFTCDGVAYPKGTFVLPTSQPYGLFLKNVFEEQKYPDLRKYPDLWQGLVSSRKIEGAPFEAYDMMGWTLPYQFGVKTVAANTPVEVRMTPQKDIVFARGEVVGKGGAAWILDHAANASATAVNRILKAGGVVRWARKAFTSGGAAYPEGAIIVEKAGSASPTAVAKDLGLRITALSETPKVPVTTLRTPRLGVYQSWVPSEEEGWLRLILEQHEFSYTTLHDADVKAGSLKVNYDVIILPDHYAPRILVDGWETGIMPPKYVGGLGTAGLNNLKAFVEAGGTLVFMNGTAALATDSFGVAARNVLKDAKREDFICSGALLRIEFDTAQPLAYGMARSAPAVFAGGCSFDIFPSFEPGKEVKSVAKFPVENLLLSGWIYGERYLRQKSAIVEAPLGKGKMILFGIPVTYRAMSYGTFKLIFNAIFYGAAAS